MAAITSPQLLFIFGLVFNLHQSTSWTPNWNHQHSAYTAKTSYYNTVPFTDNPPLANTQHQYPVGSAYTQHHHQQQQQQQQPLPASSYNIPYGPVVAPQPQFQGLFLPAPPGQTPNCAVGGATYCEVVDYYPKKVILKLVQQGKFDLNTLLLNEKIVYPQKYVYPQPEPTYSPPPAPQTYYNKPSYRHDWENITLADERHVTRTNFNTSNNYVPPLSGTRWRGKRQAFGAATLCDQRASNKIIFAARNFDGQWKYVVNLPEIGTTLTQRITVQECVNPNGGCRTDLCSPPSNVRTRCVQQMVQTRLVSLHPSGQRLTNEVFQLPSACVCSFSFG